MPQLVTCVALCFANHVTDDRSTTTNCACCFLISFSLKDDHPDDEPIADPIGTGVNIFQEGINAFAYFIVHLESIFCRLCFAHVKSFTFTITLTGWISHRRVEASLVLQFTVRINNTALNNLVEPGSEGA